MAKVRYKDNQEAVSILLSEDIDMLSTYILGNDIDYPIYRDGTTLLMYGITRDIYKSVEFLLKNGANVNIQDNDGWTALHFAATALNNSEIYTKLLLDHNADVSLRDSYGNTALWRATFDSRGFGGVIKLLRAHGADPFLKNNYDASPYDVAHTIANYDIKQFFTDCKKDEEPSKE